MANSKQFVYSLLIVITVSACCFALGQLLPYRVVAFFLLVTVSIIAVLFDIIPVLVSAIASALIWDLFFIPPRFALHVDNTEDVILLIMYFIIVLIHAVLTNRIRRAENIARIKEERSNSVQLYNTVLNSLSHELRTPLATIIASADNLQSDHFSSQQKEEMIQEINKAALRMDQQVENLLNISRLESGHMQPKYDWTDIIETIHGIVRRSEDLHPGYRIHISIPPNIPLCYLDKGMFDQIIFNLINNACVHNAPGTQIMISAVEHGGLLHVIIEDKGKGIDRKEVLEKLSRHAKPMRNAGLGLSIVKGFTEALKGEVQIEDVSPHGARFVIVLPVKTTTG